MAEGRALLLLAAQLGAWLGAGRWVLRGLGTRTCPRLETALVALGTGLAATSLAILALGLVGLFGQPAALTLLAMGWGGLAAAWHPGRRASARPRTGPSDDSMEMEGSPSRPAWPAGFAVRSPAQNAPAGTQRRIRPLAAPFELFSLSVGSLTVAALMAAAVLALALDLPGALAPPTATDALVYHLALPRLWLLQGRIAHLPTHFFSDAPAVMETQYLWALALGSDRLPALLQWSLAGATALAIAALGARLCGAGGSGRAPGKARLRYAAATAGPADAPPAPPCGIAPTVAGAAAAALFLTTPMVTWEATSPFNDLALTFLATLAIAAFLDWRRSGNVACLRVCGLLAGACCGVKVTAMAFVAPLAVLVVWHCGRTTSHDNIAPDSDGPTVERKEAASQCGRACRWKRLAAFTLPAVIAALPWYARAWADTGNPVWPLAYRWLGGREWSGDLARLFRLTVTDAYGFGRGPLAFLALPWNLTFHGERFDAGRNGFGPAFLALMPAAVLTGRDRRWAALGAVVVAGVGLWFAFGSQQGRFLLPLLPLLCLLCAEGAVRLAARSRAGGWAAAVGVWGGVGLGLAVSLAYNAQCAPVDLGRESRLAFLARKAPYYPACRLLNATLPPHACVLIEFREGYYLRRPYLKDGILQGAIDYSRLRTPADLRARLRALGVTHVLYTRPAGATSFGPPGTDPYVARERALHNGLRARMRRMWQYTIPVPIGRTMGSGLQPEEVALYALSGR